MNDRLFDNFLRVGFRKWYERQLLSSHAHMVLAVLSALALVASLEAFRGAQGDARVADVLFVVVCAAVGIWALRRYMFLLMHAEDTANQANCPDCGEYGRFRVVAQHPRTQAVDVQCRRCACGWTIRFPSA